ncbi:hypothetical protein PN36_17895 [Candidatus Thiomargarita nelsonii]|uniref:Cytoskeleton protein RodZ-like C-terminal domain-containing protein n=1 Tax=Candidatus Thiomargarita nelsonii TaxID=1003181 RepID=A0A0A6P4Q8_9GAMM|nr:hypothetical protein PN36_17895 [Candidatus Thiomargarita nelsonii]
MKNKPIFQPIPLDYDEHANTRAREDFNNIIRLDNIKVHDESDSLIDDDDYDLIISDSKEHDDNLDIVVTNDNHTNTIPLSNDIKKSHDDKLANSGMSPGEILRQMREHKKISLQEVGKELSLDVHVVEKLEADNYDDLPPLTFIRGYVRNYAKFLGISEQAIMVSFDKMNPLEYPIIIPPQGNGNTAGRREKYWRNIGTIALSIPLILMLLWLFYLSSGNDDELIAPSVQSKTEKAEPQSDESDKEQSPRLSSAYISLENNKTPENKQEYPVVSENEPDASEVIPPVVDEPTLVVTQKTPEETSDTFISEPTSSIKYLSVHLKKEEVWMRITDSTGKKLHGGTVKAGTVLSFKGEPPFYIQTVRNDFDIEYEGRIKRIGMYPKQPGENNISIIAPSKQFLSVQLVQKDVWMRITDSTGEKLHGGTVKAGETLNLMGKSPFYIQTIRDDFSIKYQEKTNRISEYPKQGNQFIIK